ncbi:helix-turn-helix transcriptional regulator [Croceiramulus getboli]|nr:helix-turn-helix transcriptional regulator [Flavobacteriaceae bacterium YJPT1-3]
MNLKELENNAGSLVSETVIEPGFSILLFDQQGQEFQQFSRSVSSSIIQFHFCIKGSLQLQFNQGNYQLPLQEEHSLLLYNPQRELPLNLNLAPDTWMVSVLISIKKFHSLFSREASFITFLSEENKERKYYKDGLVSPAMAVVLNQLINYNLHPSVKELYFKGKAYELLSLYFNRPADVDIEQCPFLVDEENVAKIKKAKELIISRMAEPPTLQELADEIQLSINKLKEGFKQIYGEPVYSFLFDYKMETARQLLATGAHNVNEVGHQVGYSTSSHFIAAFKKKFGTTPKKYIQSVTTNL